MSIGKQLGEVIVAYEKMERELYSTKKKIERAESLSVTNILKGVDGDEDYYFKSVEEVVEKLSELGSIVEDYELGIKVAPCIQEKLEAAVAHLSGMRVLNTNLINEKAELALENAELRKQLKD